MSFGAYNLTKIRSLQPVLQSLAQQLLDIAAQEGIALKVVQGYRSPAQQEALFTSATNVTNAPALSSYHNYGLAFDVVPAEYLNLPNWNPAGPLWDRIGALGEGIGLEWGGRWTHPDRPHFQIQSSLAPIEELKAYYERAVAAGKSLAESIMPITIAPAAGGVAIIVLIVVGWIYLVPMLKRHGIL